VSFDKLMAGATAQARKEALAETRTALEGARHALEFLEHLGYTTGGDIHDDLAHTVAYLERVAAELRPARVKGV